MLFKVFLEQQWKEYTRSSIWQRNLATNIFIGFFMLLMMGYLLMLGIFIDPVLRKFFPDDDPVAIFNGVIIYYLGFDLLIRYLMQSLPTFAIESYLHLPIRKRTMVHFVVSKSVFHPLNFLPLLVFLPFALISVAQGYNSISTLVWIFSVIFLVFNNNFLATYFKRQLVSKPLITLFAGLVLISLALLDHFNLIKLSVISSFIFSSILKNPVLAAIPFLLVIFSYGLNFFLLKSKMYPEEIIKRKSYHVQDIPRIKYLTSLGLTGDLVMLDIKLWWRHKRTRTLLYMFPIFVLYGFMFYPMPEYQNNFGWLIFVGTFMTGGMTMNYLNYAFGYESNHFDGILTSRVDMDLYIKAKLSIGMLITTVCFILTIPYLFFDTDILLINFVTFLFNLGFISYVLLLMATYNKKRMDLSKGSSFNYQGVGATNWLVLMPAFIMPMLIYAPFGLLGYKYIGLAAIGFIGLIGLLTRKYWIRMIERNFLKRKYIMAEGFREGG
jgi:hypothetical protein